MRYWLVRLIDNAEPYEMMAFPEEVDGITLRESINEFMAYYQEHEDYGIGMFIEEYVVARLQERFNAEIIPWNNEDNLYI